MGLIDFFKGRVKPAGDQQASRFEMLNAYQPAFYTWSGEVYESQLVLESLDAHARHAIKLKPSFEGSAAERLKKTLVTGPNEWQSWADYVERCSNIYQSQNNLFISPILDEYGRVIGYWPLFPSKTDVRMKDGKAFLRFEFYGGKMMSMELSRIGIVRKHQFKDDFFGESNVKPLKDTLDMDAMTVQGIIEGIRAANSYQFMAELTQNLFPKDIKKQREEFDDLNFSPKAKGRGLLLFNGNLKNVKQIEPGKMPISSEQTKLIEENVMKFFGTNEDIMKNTADSAKLNAFFDGATEPFAIKLSDAMTRMTFSTAEQQRNNRIHWAANRLQYMSVGDKINMTKELGDRGMLMIDEVRELFNYPPLPDGAGQHAPIRGEFYMVDKGKDPEPAKEPEKKPEEQTEDGGKEDE